MRVCCAQFAADGDAFKGEMGFGGLEHFFGGAALLPTHTARTLACIASAMASRCDPGRLPRHCVRQRQGLRV